VVNLKDRKAGMSDWTKETAWKSTSRWEDNIISNFTGIDLKNVNWIKLTEDRDPSKGSCEPGTLKCCLFPVPIRNYELIWNDSDP